MTDHEKLREALRFVRGLRAGWDSEKIDAVCDAAESTLPKTKMVAVYHVEYAHRGVPRVEAFEARHYAEGRAEELEANRDGSRELPAFACIRVTGPHQQEVPA